ncbi:MAG: hypothetical protein MUC55_01105 [Burkholderiales bacterium]|jgi:hypothetical protein|nr:hypothetical protein [Burkholderiales bacterium]
MKARIALTLAALAIAGCQTPPPAVERPVETRAVAVPSPVEEAIAFGSRVPTLAPDEQRREVAAAEQAFATQPSPTTRMRLALLLGTPGAVVQDDARAASVLTPLAAPDAQDPLAPLARVLSGQIAARQREVRRAATLKGELDTARVQADAARNQAEAARAQAEAARAQSEELRNQLEALKALERRMIERGSTPPAKR